LQRRVTPRVTGVLQRFADGSNLVGHFGRKRRENLIVKHRHVRR
jgi:hypothetical protein